jgi:hypothetical protein
MVKPRVEECREVLGAARFADLEAEMAAVPEADRDGVYSAITTGARLKRAHEQLDPKAVEALEEALAGVDRAIKKLRQAWAGVRSPAKAGDRPDYLPPWPGEGLERGLREAHDVFDGWGLRETRETLLGEPKRSGRPRAAATETDAELRDAGVSDERLRRALLRAAGLTTPKKAPASE